MVRMRGFLVAFLVVVCIVAVGGTREDGRPRPRLTLSINDLPDKSYGPLPVTYDSGVAAKCEWYGWASTVFATTPTYGAVCMSSLRGAFLNSTIYPPGSLKPYRYYWTTFFADAKNESYCYLGCFDLSASSPPPLGSLYPPPPIDEPPPATPPASIYPPPPSETPVPPPLEDSTPPPPALVGTPPVAGTPPATRTINLNSAGVVQPSGFVAVFVAGLAFLLNQIAA